MNTYAHITQNRLRSALLILLFPITFAVTLAVMLAVLMNVFGVDLNSLSTVCGPSGTDCAYVSRWEVIGVIMLRLVPGLWLLALGWIFASYYLGDFLIMVSVNATKVTSNNHPDLYHLVENLAITRGLPTPTIYLINDDSLNAFATGRNPQHAAIVFTKGLVENLERVELEGVAAHELAHIENYDTRLMLLAVAGISFFTLAGEICLNLAAASFRSRPNMKSHILLFVLGGGLFIYGYVIAPLIRLALSRQREYQADALAALTTRHPQALANALKKISKNCYTKAFCRSHSVSSLCIACPLPREGLLEMLSGIFTTHPPIRERVPRLEQMNL